MAAQCGICLSLCQGFRCSNPARRRDPRWRCVSANGRRRCPRNGLERKILNHCAGTRAAWRPASCVLVSSAGYDDVHMDLDLMAYGTRLYVGLGLHLSSPPFIVVAKHFASHLECEARGVIRSRPELPKRLQFSCRFPTLCKVLNYLRNA